MPPRALLPFEQPDVVQVQVCWGIAVLPVIVVHALFEYMEAYTLLDESAVYDTYVDPSCGMHVPRGANINDVGVLVHVVSVEA